MFERFVRIFSNQFHALSQFDVDFVQNPGHKWVTSEYKLIVILVTAVSQSEEYWPENAQFRVSIPKERLEDSIATLFYEIFLIFGTAEGQLRENLKNQDIYIVINLLLFLVVWFEELDDLDQLFEEFLSTKNHLNIFVVAVNWDETDHY